MPTIKNPETKQVTVPRRPQLTAAVSKDSEGAAVRIKKTGVVWPRQDLKEVTR